MFSNTLSFLSSLSASDQVSHPYIPVQNGPDFAFALGLAHILAL